MNSGSMRHWNILYWIVLPCCLLLLIYLNKRLGQNHREYFGFAENKQTEINLDKDVIIHKIHVKTGSKVNKGQLLMEVSSPEMEQEIAQLDLTLPSFALREQMELSEIRSEILDLKRQKELRISELQTRIHTEESNLRFYLSLVGEHEANDGSRVEYINQLKRELSTISDQYDHMLEHYEKMLRQPRELAVREKAQRVQSETLQEKLKEFRIIAPYDGIIGNINVREGEFVEAFTRLINFYEPTPPLVLAFIQEKFDVRVQPGDSVTVQSLYSPAKTVKGVVQSKGHRIIEIPEKFRKIPDVRIYGVEVFISIPPQNLFLQQEVLKIKPLIKS